MCQAIYQITRRSILGRAKAQTTYLDTYTLTSYLPVAVLFSKEEETF